MEAKYNTKLDSEKIKANIERNREAGKERASMIQAQQKMQAQSQQQAPPQQPPPMPQMPPNA
jgi:hypothetical protein